MGSLLLFLGGKNLVYLIWQSSFVKVSGNQGIYNLFYFVVIVPELVKEGKINGLNGEQVIKLLMPSNRPNAATG